MNEGDESFPSTETRKRNRCFGFKYSSKKALERSRVMRRTIKAGGSKFTTVTKALSYPSVLVNEIRINDHHDFAIGSRGPPLFESVDELKGKRKEMSYGDAISDKEYP
jgi:hypothetical protein